MSSSPMSNTRCTTGGTQSRRWIIAALVVALIGLGVPAFADTAPAKKLEMKPAAKSTDERVPKVEIVPDSGSRSGGSLAAPGNDDCSGAIPIPDGPYPVNSPISSSADANPQGADEGIFPCAAAPGSGTDYTVWYSFTPSVSTLYTFTTCPANGAVGNTVLDTVLGVFSSTGGSCPQVTNLACADSSGCATAGDFSTVGAVLQAGQTYFVVVGNWAPGGAPSGNYQVHVEQSSAPPNDTCAGAIDVPLNRVVLGNSAGAADDYQSPANAACFAGIGQTLTTSPGRDIVFTFTAPEAGNYTVREAINDTSLSGDHTIYTSSSCPGGGGTVTCLAGGGANRGQIAGGGGSSTGQNIGRSEEIDCLTLADGEQIFIFLDNGAAGNDGNVGGVEVTKCVEEVEPNDTIATATPYDTLACGENHGATSVAPTYHCILGTNPNGLCTPVAAPAVSACTGGGVCFPDSVCQGGPTPGAACRQTCVGGTNAGTLCASNTQCTGGGTCTVSGGCGQCVGGATPGAACTGAAQCGGGTCNTGICSRTGNEGDVDFWTLGTLPAGHKVWTAVDAIANNDYDYRMRVTSTTETLGFDDQDATSMTGSTSSVIAGAVSTGTETFVRVSKTTAWASEPYHLYTVVTPPIADAQLEPGGDAAGNDFGWPGDGLFVPYFSGASNGYIRGVFSAVGDTDCYQTLANEGDDIVMFGDSNPTRAEGATPGIPQLIIYDAANAGISNFVFTTGVVRAIGPQTGNAGLEALTPENTSFFMHWRARYTGAFELCAYPFANTNLPALPPYPKNYAASATLNCGPLPNAGPGTTTADVSVAKTGPSGNLPTGSVFQYVITVTNNGTEIAQGVNLLDTLPANVNFSHVVIDDTLGGNNTACLSLPTPGTNDAPIDCTNISMAPGSSTVYTITAQLANCSEGGLVTENSVTISTISTDPNSANDSASTTFTSEANTACLLLLCDSSSCIDSACSIEDTCNGTVCEAQPLNCDDLSICTEDSCDVVAGCINDPSLGDQCDDGNPCTGDDCHPVDGCVFPPAAAGIACDDFFSCTANDVCDGNGGCLGTNPCDDGNDCTQDFFDEGNACACSYAPSDPGTGCSDGNACTSDDVCDGAENCVGGGPTVCDDNNPCTDDTCDSGLGCVYTPNTSSCDDGNACTAGDACADGACVGGDPTVCDDGNPCTDDSCNPGSGCVYTDNSNACDDGNACTVGDTCGSGSCQGGAPVVCTALDQCHVAGVCDTGTGVCSDPNAPDGTTCDDGNAGTSNDSCQAGVCTGGTACTSTNSPQSTGFYKKQCGGHGQGGGSITDADALCVANLTATFSDITTAAQVCDVLATGGQQSSCEKDEDQLMALALNICTGRVCESQEIDTNCGRNTKTVGESLAEADEIFSVNPNTNSCNVGGCLGREINNGRALKLNSLNLSVAPGE